MGGDAQARIEATLTRDFAKILRDMDWPGRHFYFERIRMLRPSVAEAVLNVLSPDEHLQGRCTGTPASAVAEAAAKSMPKAATIPGAGGTAVAKAAAPPAIPLPYCRRIPRQSTLMDYWQQSKRQRRE